MSEQADVAEELDEAFNRKFGAACEIAGKAVAALATRDFRAAVESFGLALAISAELRTMDYLRGVARRREWKGRP